jgi:hypothetical protein
METVNLDSFRKLPKLRSLRLRSGQEPAAGAPPGEAAKSVCLPQGNQYDVGKSMVDLFSYLA